MLGIASRKAGAEIDCPKCGLSQVVPSEEAAAAALAMDRGGHGSAVTDDPSDLVVYDDEHDSKAMSMAAIQDHVALPVLDPTEGQEYALQAYGWDGWARSFDFAPDNMEYVVTSAGPDGDLDTDDDISATFVRQDTLGHAGTYYLARRDGTLYLATRRHLVGGIEGPAGALADSYDGGELGEWVELPGNEGLYYAIPLTVEFLEDHVWAFDPEYGEAEHSAADAVTAVEALYESHATDDDPDPVVVQIYGVSIES